MSSMIAFLEHLGREESLRHAETDQLDSALEGAGFEPAFRDAMLARDRSRLQALMQCQATICCGLVRPEPDDDDEQEPGKEDEEIRVGQVA